jgi:DNA-directed RNA polymerase subunit RPC12/RpoP
MKVFDCKCSDCKSEFQAVLEDGEEKVQCPACESMKVEMTEAEVGCGGSCGGCSGGCASQE